MAKEETPEEYKERLRKSREEQLESQARRKQEGIARKARQEMEREQGRFAAFNAETLFIHFDARAVGSRKKAKEQSRGQKGPSRGSPQIIRGKGQAFASTDSDHQILRLCCCT